jgi:hypothetical protein
MTASDHFAYRMRAFNARHQMAQPDDRDASGYCLDAPQVIPAGFSFSSEDGQHYPACTFRMDTHKEAA